MYQTEWNILLLLKIINMDMEIEEKEKLKEDSSDKAESTKPSILQIVCDTVWLALTTAVLLGVYIATFLSSDSIFGVQNTTGEAADLFYTQVHPSCSFVNVQKPIRVFAVCCLNKC